MKALSPRAALPTIRFVPSILPFIVAGALAIARKSVQTLSSATIHCRRAFPPQPRLAVTCGTECLASAAGRLLVFLQPAVALADDQGNCEAVILAIILERRS